MSFDVSAGGNSARILGVILARGGSKGVPRKNIKPLNSKPLIVYTIDEGLKSELITDLIVSTDDQEIAQVARESGAKVPFMRPAELATDSATSKACLQHAVLEMEKQGGQPYDFIVELMCTNPLKTVEDIDAILHKLIDTKADSVIGVIKLDDHHPARIKKIVDDRIVDFCVPEPNGARRQDLKPDAYIRNGSIYAMKRDVLMIQDRRYGTPDSRPYIFSPERSVNIDSKLDWDMVETRMRDKSNGMKIVCATPVKHLEGVFEILCQAGEVIYEPYIKKQELSALLARDKSITALFVNPNKMGYVLDRSVLEGSGVSVINTASTGLNHINVSDAADLDIEIVSLTEDRHIIEQLPSTSELAFGLMMGLIRPIGSSFESVKSGLWDYEPFMGHQVRGLTLGVIGYGRLGSLMADYGNVFGMNVLVYDPLKKVEGFEQVALSELLERSDVVSLHVHVNDQTRGMISSSAIASMKSGSILINTSRGELVDEHALARAIRSGHIAGYGTDVLADEFEDIERSPLLSVAREGLPVLVTPHIGGMTWEGQQLAFSHAAKKFLSYQKKV